MALPQINPLLADQLIILISGVFMESFSADEQAVIGTFLATLGSVISFNSVYSLYTEGQAQILDQETEEKEMNSSMQDKQFELLQKSIEKIQEEITKLKKQ